MYEDIDFYSLSNREKRKLINNKRVVSSTSILSELPEDNPPVRVFEKSVEELILDKLEKGIYSISELQKEFDIRRKDIENILVKFRGWSKFIGGKSFKIELLQERKGVIRVKRVNGIENNYKLEKIPFFARVADPTLGISLLNLEERLMELPVIKHIPNYEKSNLDKEYSMIIGDFWGIDPQEIFDFIIEYDRKYVETTLLPLPILKSKEEYKKVDKRLKQADKFYKRLNIKSKNINEVGDYFINKAKRRNEGIFAYQLTFIDLADLKRHSKLENPSLISEINSWIDKIIKILDPNYEFKKDLETEKKVYDENNLKTNEILNILSNQPKFVDEIYNSLPPIVKADKDIGEIEELLETLNEIGMVEKNIVNEKNCYKSVN